MNLSNQPMSAKTVAVVGDGQGAVIALLRAALADLHGQVVTLRAEKRIDTKGNSERTNLLTAALVGGQQALDASAEDALKVYAGGAGGDLLRELAQRVLEAERGLYRLNGSEDLPAWAAGLAVNLRNSAAKVESLDDGSTREPVAADDPDCGLPSDVADRIRAIAHEQRAEDGSIEFDDRAAISFSHEQVNGTYVQAWVWIEFDHDEVIGGGQSAGGEAKEEDAEPAGSEA